MAPLLQIENLKVKYHTRDGILTAIRDVSFHVDPGEIVGVVGESGCGKSTIAATVMRLLPPNGEIAGGDAFEGRDLCALDEESMRKLRGKEISMIFQDPMTSLNPFFSVETQMMDALRAHRAAEGQAELRRLAIDMLNRVGIPDPEIRIKGYPHQFSGGMRQRIMVAIALMSHPALLVADEPTSALDVTLEAQIVDLIRGLRDELGTAVLYITHDLGVVAQLCDRVIVMYAGNIIEAGDVYSTFAHPQHPYTQALLRSHPARLLAEVPPGDHPRPCAQPARPATRMQVRSPLPPRGGDLPDYGTAGSSTGHPDRAVSLVSGGVGTPVRARNRNSAGDNPCGPFESGPRGGGCAGRGNSGTANPLRGRRGPVGRDLPGQTRQSARGGWCQHFHHARRDVGAGRRIGFRQDDSGPHHPPAGRSDRRRYFSGRAGDHAARDNPPSAPCGRGCK